jgi:hypothetical protein
MNQNERGLQWAMVIDGENPLKCRFKPRLDVVCDGEAFKLFVEWLLHASLPWRII